MSSFPLNETLPKLRLRRLQDGGGAGVALCSLPIPEGCPTDLRFTGLGGSATPLGLWPDGKTPRRLLIAADSGGDCPESLSVEHGDGENPAAASDWAAPELSMDLFDTCPDPAFMWERHAVKITWRNKSFGLVMGMRTQGRFHWWEACRLQILSQDDFCVTFEAGGAIPAFIYDTTDLAQYKGYYDNPYLHKHRWLYGRVFARLYANGVCEVYAHHVNNRFFDDGLDLPDCVPVIGFKTYDAPAPAALYGPWTGDKEEITVGHARLDLREARSLATPAQPGAFSPDNPTGFFVWQPYLGAELYGGQALLGREGATDGFIFRAEDGVFPRGFARTVRFSFSLSDRSPQVARYLPPAWWYGLCRELTPDALLPVSREYDAVIDLARDFVEKYTIQGGFEDGGTTRYARALPDGRYEPSWEGEFPHAQLLMAWRSGREEDYRRALRAAYYFNDVCIDHASNVVRMHGWPPPATSVPMFRAGGSVAAYLETGDKTLLEDARGIVDSAWRMHKNSWPRLCTGRDASFLRGAMLLVRYFNDRHYRELVRDVITDVIATQRPDGAFGDQGGGSGVHQWAAYIVKPWMGCMAVGGLVDYLELYPEQNGDTEPVWACVKRFGDFLLRERFYHAGRAPGSTGVFDDEKSQAPLPVGMGWSYQHYFKDGTQFRDFFHKEWFDLKNPRQDFWHWEYLSRIMTFCSQRSGDPAYFDAWAESAGIYYALNRPITTDHPAIQILQYIPWTQEQLAQARYTADGFVCRPLDFGPRTPKSFRVQTPDGEREFKV